MARSPLFTKLADRYDEEKSYVTRPVEWSSEKADLALWSKQREIAQSVVDHRYTAVHAAHDMGKSLSAADLCCWWIDAHPPGTAFVISTAPTASQVSTILWREIAKIHTRASLPGRINRAGYPQWYIGSSLVGFGRKPADYEDSNLQGQHDGYMLIVIDEAGGVSKGLFDQVDTLVTNEDGRVLAIGNPDDPGSHFASVCKPGSDWHVIHMDGLRSPNFSAAQVIGTDAANPRYPLTAALMRADNVPFSEEPINPNLRKYLLSPLWVEERLRRWAGIAADEHTRKTPQELEEIVRRRAATSPLVQSKVRGIFPTESSVGVIPLGWVEMAINRWHDLFDDGALEKLHEIPGRFVLGVDVAYTGEDETAFAHRYGDIVARIDRFRIADTLDTAQAAAAHLHTPQSLAVVDVLNIGAGVFDQLRRWHRDGVIAAMPIAFNAGAGDGARRDRTGSFRFRNNRAAAWWNMRELLDPSRGSRIALPDDERLKAELTTVRYEYQGGGTVKIESKDEIRKRLGRSTDTADAVIQSFWTSSDVFSSTQAAFPWRDATSRERGEAGVIGWADYSPFSEADMGGLTVPRSYATHRRERSDYGW